MECYLKAEDFIQDVIHKIKTPATKASPAAKSRVDPGSQPMRLPMHKLDVFPKKVVTVHGAHRMRTSQLYVLIY